MIKLILIPAISLTYLINFTPKPQAKIPVLQPVEITIAQRELPLNNRQPDKYVNEIYRDNILLNMAYLQGKVTKRGEINWDEVKKPFHYEFVLNPKQTFAFHDDIYTQYMESIVKTTDARFNFDDGFKSDGYLVGDGVCHLASLINWAAQDAKLDVYAPTDHNFAKIEDVPKEYGVSIYYYPGRTLANAKQNLYITNNRPNPVTFGFDYQNDLLKISITETEYRYF